MLFLELIWAHLSMLIILGKGPTEGLDHTSTAEAKYPINFSQSGKGFLFVNGTKIYQFKAKDSEIKDFILYLGNDLKIFTINNMNKTGLKRVVNFFSVASNHTKCFYILMYTVKNFTTIYFCLN